MLVSDVQYNIVIQGINIQVHIDFLTSVTPLGAWHYFTVISFLQCNYDSEHTVHI